MPLLRSASIAAGAAIALTATIFLTSPGAADTSAPSGAPALPRVRVAEVEAAPDADTVRLYGLVRASDRADVAFTAGGRLVARPVRLGEAVQAGDVLARLDPLPWAHAARAAALDLDGLRANLAQARADRDRLMALDATGAIAPAEAERLATQVTALEAALARAEVARAEAARQADEATLRAPFDGVVTRLFAEPGDTVGAGTPIVTLQGATHEIVLEAPEAVWAALPDATVAAVRAPALGCALPGTSIAGFANATGGPGGLFEVRLSAPSAPGCAVAPGVGVEVDLRVPARPALAVPVRAVVDPTGEGAAVLRVRDGRAERVPVVPVGLDGDRARVVGALGVGDAVVVAGLLGLVAGDAVEVTR